ncbi:MAG: polysaccharide biosynthesis tyrosine autokinase, partial [Quisquiliibacterium sp.]
GKMSETSSRIVLGSWLSSRATGPEVIDLPLLGSGIIGNDAIQVDSFQVPPALHGVPLILKATAGGFELMTTGAVLLGKGKVGASLSFAVNGIAGTLLIKSLSAAPGARFQIVRQPQLAAIQGLQGGLTIVEQGRQSGVIRVSLEDPDPARAARIVNAIGTSYVKQNIARKTAEIQKSLEFLDEQLPKLRAELEATEGRFNEFRTRNRVFDLSANAQSVLSELVGLRVKEFELQQARTELVSRYTSNHPRVKTLDTQISQVRGLLSRLEQQVDRLPRLEQELLRLTRDVKVSSELYAGLLNSYQQLRLAKASQVGNVRVVDKAIAPIVPVKPRSNAVLGMALAGGLAAGLALGFLRHQLRHTLRDSGEIERALGITVYSDVPHSLEQYRMDKTPSRLRGQQNLLAVAHPEASAIESLRSLRTALQFAMLDAPNNRLLIAGATPGLGKSFVASNFAAVLAAGGRKVLLVDADVRRGHLHRYFGIDRGVGLSEVIAGSAKVDEVINRGVLPNLDFLTTGKLPPNPAELLMSSGTARVLDQISAGYDVVVLDSAPVLPVADALALAPNVGTVLLLARANISTLGDIDEAVRRLRQAGVMARGVVFNDFDLSHRRYGYSRYGRYRYRYRAYRYSDYSYRRDQDT